ncbi:hypothetical protein BC826DRAFT_1176303 [Russula brevipes]|nr:hypothetical protein BC826DRAFT_1176303 [Russula brevipes]
MSDKSDVIVDDESIKWEPISKTPDHILTVYRPEDPNKKFIAKKIREGSDEVKILTLLKDMKLKSHHVIQMIESFGRWAILPKMIAVQDYYVESQSEGLGGKASRIFTAGAESLTGISSPTTLSSARIFCLKIIDFDVAMRVTGEDEMVDDQCGTELWMAPEVEENERHSPIRADRWACGRVLLYLLRKFTGEDKFTREDERLKAFARNLSAYDPKERPSLLEWCDNSASSCSDVGNGLSAGSKNASQHRRDRSEGGESTKPPNAKKRRLDGSH